MAIDYSALFGSLGKIAKNWNDLEAIADTTLPALLDEIADEFGDVRAPIATITSDISGMQANTDSWRATLIGYAKARLLDIDTVISPLGITSSSIADVLAALIVQMTVDAQTIKRSQVTLGSVSAGSANAGNGTVLISATLDGVNAPSAGILKQSAYAGLDSELAASSQTLKFVCDADSFTDRRNSGAESFSVRGAAATDPASFKDEGIGIGPTIQASAGANLLSNGDFESFSSNAPSRWSIDAGIAGTHVGSSSSAYRGSSALQLTGDGSLAAITLSQPLLIDPLRRYVLAARIKGDAGLSSGTLTIQFTGTGYTPGSGEKIEIAAGSIGTSYSLRSAFLLPPANRPADLALQISWSGTPNAAKSIYIDDLQVVPLIYHGSIGAAIIAGATPFVRGDYFTIQVTNDGAGVFQEFFRRAFRVQLPSAASPTISDSLAQ